VLVEDVDLVDRLQHGLVAVAGDRDKSLVGVLDVVGRQLAPVDGGLGVPADALLSLKT